jgi:tetratricopeptide (TPR) repeat protein
MSPPPPAAELRLQIGTASPSSDRGARHAESGALVLRAVERVLEGEATATFLLRRAAREIEALPSSRERAALRRVVAALEEGASVATVAEALVGYGYELEAARRLEEADAVLTRARALVPADAELALHAGRIARKLGDRERALALYRAVRELDGADGTLARLAAVGEAVVSGDAERALGRAIRAAVRAGDAEAAAVGLEERARVRRSARRRRAAVRDLCLAALRYRDRVDLGRVAHRIADLAFAEGDLAAAREALFAALASGDNAQRDHARSRLHTLARDLGDEVGARRWRSFRPAPLVSLSAYRPTKSAAPAAPASLVRWRRALERRAKACGA